MIRRQAKERLWTILDGPRPTARRPAWNFLKIDHRVMAITAAGSRVSLISQTRSMRRVPQTEGQVDAVRIREFDAQRSRHRWRGLCRCPGDANVPVAGQGQQQAG